MVELMMDEVQKEEDQSIKVEDVGRYEEGREEGARERS